MRVEMTPGENVDLNDPAVKAAILEQVSLTLFMMEQLIHNIQSSPH